MKHCWLFGVFVLLCVPSKSMSYDFPGKEKFENSAEAIVESINSATFTYRSKGHDFNIQELCGNLSNAHNDLLFYGMAKGRNREFLNLRNPWKKNKYHAVSQLGCVKSIKNAKAHKHPDWLDSYAGFHVGQWYNELGHRNGTTQWFATNKRGIQNMHYISRCAEHKECDCAVKDSQGRDCSWGWQYTPIAETHTAYVYRWDPENNVKKDWEKGVSVAIPYPLADVGFPGAECLLWFGKSDACIQCFSRYKKPYRTTIACLDKVGQFMINND